MSVAKTEVHLPTISGSANVLGINIPLSGSYEYNALLNNVESNDPNVVRQNGNGGLDAIAWTHGFQAGVYQGTLAGAFLNNTYISATIKYFNNGGVENTTSVNAEVLDANQVQLVCYDASFNPVNNQDVFVSIRTEYANDPADIQAIFDAVLLELDANQQAIWDKIVVRSNGIVTEVDGATYRRTNSFNASSKVINS